MLNEEKSQEYRAQHLHFLEERRLEEEIFAKGRFADGAGGLVIYRAGSWKEVEQLAKQDPYVIQGARGCDIHEWEMVSDAVLPY